MAANLPQKNCSCHVFFRTSNIRRWTKRNCCNFRMLKINYLIQRIDLGHSFLKENWSLQIFLASRMTVLWENVCLAALNLANRSWIDNVYKVFLLLQCLSFVRLLFQPLWYKTGLCKMTFLSSFAWMFYFYPHGSFLCSITYARNDLFFFDFRFVLLLPADSVFFA